MYGTYKWKTGYRTKQTKESLWIFCNRQVGVGEIDPGKCSNRMQDKDGKETCRTATLTDIGSQSSMEVQGDHNTDTVYSVGKKAKEWGGGGPRSEESNWRRKEEKTN